jgi:ESS family glutamate:Na+ symporter
MSLKLSAIGVIIIPIAIVVILQVLLAAAIAYYVLFRALGKDYDAAVACGGFIGFSISSMPVAMATMEQISKRFGPAPKAILLITLAGSFFVDLANTFIVKVFISFLPEITR